MASEPLAERAAASAAPVKRNRAVALMASGTLVSRVLGFVRTFLLAIAIGSVSSVADAVEKANTVPTIDRKSTRLNSSHSGESRMPSSA